ncbi:MAG TPA: TIGR02594 family protein [Xanthobacteraceae bacterium]|nr:TIGR02594 family protein [Xanthobacteraceae bacterium]
MHPPPKNLQKITWLAAAYQELQAGVARYGAVDAHGKAMPAYDTTHHIQNNPRILEYFAATSKRKGGWMERDSWCSAFVNWCMRQAGVVGTHSAMARSWLHWHQGETLDQPRIGAVVVFPRPPNPESGHVAMIWNVHADGSLEILGGNQGAHRADKDNPDGVSSHVSIANRAAGTALGFRWPKGFVNLDAATPAVAGANGTMLILRGIAGHYAGRDWPRGALDEPPALEYARRRGYAGRVLDVAGATGADSPQTQIALAEFRRDPSVTALYGFSGGGYNVLHIIHAMTQAERGRLRLVVVLGAPGKHGASREPLYRGSWEVVYRHDPPGGHMAGPRALLATLH